MPPQVTQTVGIDYETYWDAECSLKKLPVSRYIRHPKFHVHGAAVCVDGGDPKWLDAKDVGPWLNGFDWDRTALLAHNAAFDGYVARHVHDVPPPALYVDTQALVKWANPGQSAALEQAAKRHLAHMPGKGGALANTKGLTWDEIKADLELYMELTAYAVHDLRLACELHKLLWDRFPAEERTVSHHTVLGAVEPCLKLDRRAALAELTVADLDFEAVIAKSGLALPYLSSNQKFASYLAGRLGDRNAVPRKPSPTDPERTIPALAKNDPQWLEFKAAHPELSDLCAARERAKSRIVETRCESLLAHARPGDDAITVPLNYAGAHTMRFSGAGGLNFQNLPGKRTGSMLRHAVKPLVKAHCIYRADFNAIEPRSLGWIAGERAILDVFERGGDPYCAFASQVFGFEVNKDDHPHERHLGKQGVLALGYGTGAKTLRYRLMQDDVHITLAEADRMVQVYRGLYVAVMALWDACKGFMGIMASGRGGDVLRPTHSRIQCDGPSKRLRLPNGAGIEYPGLHVNRRATKHFKAGDHLFMRRGKLARIHGPRMVENIVQAFSRHVMVDALHRVMAEHERRLRVAMHSHDDLILVGRPDRGVLESVTAIMEEPPSWAPGLPLKVEADIVGSYGG